MVTPGTNLNTQALDETKKNYLMCIVYVADGYGVSMADITTGDYFVTEIETDKKLLDEIVKFSPTEIICNQSFSVSGIDLEDMKERLGITIYSLDDWYFDDELCKQALKKHFNVSTLDGIGLTSYDSGTIAAGALPVSYTHLLANTVFSFVVCVLNGIAVKRYLHYRQEIPRTFLVPILSSVIMGAAAWGVHAVLVGFIGNFLATMIAICVGAFIYFVLLVRLRGVSPRELASFPKGDTLVAVARKMRLIP